MLRAAAPALLLCMVTACGSSGDSSAGPSESVFGGRSGDDGSGSGSGGGGSDDFPGLGGGREERIRAKTKAKMWARESRRGPQCARRS